MITPIEKLTPLTGLDGSRRTADATPKSAFGSFESIFKSALQNVQDTEKEKVEAQYLLATGQLDNPAALQIATSKYDIAVELLVQLRSRALEAYSELTRINL